MVIEKYDQLSQLVKTMDLPDHRKTAAKPANVQWLLQNMSAKNKSHKNYGTAFKLSATILDDLNMLSNRDKKNVNSQLESLGLELL